MHFIVRTAAQEVAAQGVEACGVTIPAAAPVFSFVASATRDERVFPDPDVVDIHRTSPSKHLAFTRGPYYRIGDTRGRLMCGSAVRQAIERMPALRAVHDEIEWMPPFWIRDRSHCRSPTDPRTTRWANRRSKPVAWTTRAAANGPL